VARSGQGPLAGLSGSDQVTTDSNHDLRIYPNLARDMELTGTDQLEWQLFFKVS
jgi:hypothetical protein